MSNDPLRIVPGGFTPSESLPTAGPSSADSGVFDELLAKAADLVVRPENEANKAVAAFNQGAEGRLHDTLITVEKADISLKFVVGVRNRLLDAYKEIMKMGG